MTNKKAPKRNLLEPRTYYKPFEYPEAYNFFTTHERMHWVHDKQPLHRDVLDWKHKLTQNERDFLTQVFRFFTQADLDVSGAYVDKYLPLFKKPEVRMMLSSFAARECFDDKTEVLTDAGWVLFKDLPSTSKVAQFDIETNEVTYCKPLSYIRKPYKGVMHYYKNKRTDIMVTPNHRLVLINPHSRIKKIKTSSEGVWGRNFLYPVNGVSGVSGRLSTLERLLIAIQADGSIRCTTPSYELRSDRQNDLGVILAVSKQRKIDRIAKFLNELGINCEPRDKNGCKCFSFTLSGFMTREQVRGIKQFSFLKVDQIGSEKADEIIQELLFWDGNSDSVLTYYNTNEEAIDKIQALATVSSFSCTKGVNRNAVEMQILNNERLSKTKTCYRLTFSKETERSYPHRADYVYDGMVYCVSMPKGTVVTRRNGKVAMQGNCTHIAGYSHLIDTLGMPEVTYKQFAEYKEMRDKHEYTEQFMGTDKDKIVQQMAVFSAFTEGMQLFSSFIMLLNFTRFNKMIEMGQIITYSIRDESVHVKGMTWLFKTFISEHIGIWTDELKAQLYDIAKKMVALEDKFIDLAFATGGVQGLTSEEVKQYIRYIADRRLIELGMKSVYNVRTNPLPWVEDMVNAPELANFFETYSAAYSKWAPTDWHEVWRN